MIYKPVAKKTLGLRRVAVDFVHRSEDEQPTDKLNHTCNGPGGREKIIRNIYSQLNKYGVLSPADSVHNVKKVDYKKLLDIADVSKIYDYVLDKFESDLEYDFDKNDSVERFVMNRIFHFYMKTYVSKLKASAEYKSIRFISQEEASEQEHIQPTENLMRIDESEEDKIMEFEAFDYFLDALTRMSMIQPIFSTPKVKINTIRYFKVELAKTLFREERERIELESPKSIRKRDLRLLRGNIKISPTGLGFGEKQHIKNLLPKKVKEFEEETGAWVDTVELLYRSLEALHVPWYELTDDLIEPKVISKLRAARQHKDTVNAHEYDYDEIPFVPTKKDLLVNTLRDKANSNKPIEVIENGQKRKITSTVELKHTKISLIKPELIQSLQLMKISELRKIDQIDKRITDLAIEFKNDGYLTEQLSKENQRLKGRRYLDNFINKIMIESEEILGPVSTPVYKSYEAILSKYIFNEEKKNPSRSEEVLIELNKIIDANPKAALIEFSPRGFMRYSDNQQYVFYINQSYPEDRFLIHSSACLVYCNVRFKESDTEKDLISCVEKLVKTPEGNEWKGKESFHQESSIAIIDLVSKKRVM